MTVTEWLEKVRDTKNNPAATAQDRVRREIALALVWLNCLPYEEHEAVIEFARFAAGHSVASSRLTDCYHTITVSDEQLQRALDVLNGDAAEIELVTTG
jgi:hypothetical protein